MSLPTSGEEPDPPTFRLALFGFESDEALEAVTQAVPTWPQERVRDLLSTLLLPSCSLGSDSHHLDVMVAVARSEDPGIQRMREGPLFKSEYTRRLLNYIRNYPPSSESNGDHLDEDADVDDKQPDHAFPPPPWEGITWIIDLLPHWPAQALSVLDSYILAHAQVLPDGRMNALGDAASIIRAYYIGHAGSNSDRLELLASLHPTMFEGLISTLYKKLGYTVETTPPRRDGGRDVIARRADMTRRSELQIQCKRWTKRVGVEKGRELLGVVSREGSTGGVLVTTSSFTRGAIEEAQANPRLELINGGQLVLLLNEHLGGKWPDRIEKICYEGLADSR
jgi:Restriction endonuclease